MKQKWIVSYEKDRPIGRVICLPHAGGTAASFQPLRRYLPDDIELNVIEYPGHGGDRWGEPINNLKDMLNWLFECMQDMDDTPFVFFGHSMGSLLAFELARMLRGHGKTLPLHLYMSSAKAPRNLPSRFVLDAVVLPDEDFLHRIDGLGGLPSEVLESTELHTIVAALLRCDFDLMSQYTYQSQVPLPISMTVLHGEKDNHISHETLVDWRREVEDPPIFLPMRGDHFYLEDSENLAQVGDEISARFAALTQTHII